VQRTSSEHRQIVLGTDVLSSGARFFGRLQRKLPLPALELECEQGGGVKCRATLSWPILRVARVSNWRDGLRKGAWRGKRGSEQRRRNVSNFPALLSTGLGQGSSGSILH